jgi:hypothetical protein
MAKTLQFRRYPTATLASITGANGEIIVDTTKYTATVHDGSTAGGFPLVASNSAATLGATTITGTLNVSSNIIATTITTASGDLTIDPAGTADVVFSPATEVYFQSTATSVNTTTGSIIISGGIGVAGNISVGGLITTTGNGIGYATGSGGTITQATSRTTGVTLNKPSGQITLFSQALSAGAANTFTFTNSTISANDFIQFNHWSGGTIGNYTINANTSNGIANVTIRAITTVTAEAPVIQYVVIKGAAS